MLDREKLGRNTMEVKSAIKTAIQPTSISVNRNAPLMIAMLGTLNRAEYESVGAWIVIASQNAGHWVGFTRDISGEYDDMVTDGFLSETKVPDGYQYELTPFAIEQIFVRQTNYEIQHLKKEVEYLSRKPSFMEKLKALFQPNIFA
jgi:hypothetical protein